MWPLAKYAKAMQASERIPTRRNLLYRCRWVTTWSVPGASNICPLSSVSGNLLSFGPFSVPSNDFKPWVNKVQPPSHHSQWKDPRLCPTFSLQVNVTATSSMIVQYIMISRYPHSSACFPPPIFTFSFVDSTDNFLHFWLACINSPLLTFCNKCRPINIYIFDFNSLSRLGYGPTMHSLQMSADSFRMIPATPYYHTG